jgi:4-amino-4-deoxy-L-arabinose transferase-like glycosyltransferase
VSEPLQASAATASHSTGAPPGGEIPRRARLTERTPRLPSARALAPHVGLPVVVALSAVLNTNRLYKNGYANIFYSAGVKSMLHSLHNFVFVSFDSGGLVTVDKPPVALWVQALSAKLFGFSPLSLLLPEALAGVLAVALLYVFLARRLGAVAAFAGALALAVFPSFVAVSRDNGVDPLLILLLVIACGAALRACETGHWRSLLCSAIAVGLAFNTKTLAAYLAVPGIALGFLVCAPRSLARRLAQLAVAGAVMLVVSFAWIAFVELTPASKRPYVGSSTNNTEIGLAFEYNGVGRVEGQSGGPNSTVVRPGAYVPFVREHAVDARARALIERHAPRHSAPVSPPAPGVLGKPAPVGKPTETKGREKNPIPFGEAPGPLRLFEKGLGDQAGWMLPFALFGLLALALLALLDRPPDADAGDGATKERENTAELPSVPARAGATQEWVVPAQGRRPERAPEPLSLRGRRDPRLATALVLGGWFVVETAVLSLSKGIVHPYYVSGLAPATGAMAGAGAVALFKLAHASEIRRRLAGVALTACALAATALVQVVLMHREHYMLWFVPVLAAGVAAAFLALIAMRRLAAPAVALGFLLLLVVPTAYATTTWLAPVEGTFAVAGPKAAPGPGGYGVNARDEAIDRALLVYVSTHGATPRWALLSVASDTVAPIMLMGLSGGALGGYSGTDQAVSGPELARFVSKREARYVLIGGSYSLRGGNSATKAVLRACKELTPQEWHSPVDFPYGLVLFDCAGDERALAAS